MTWVSAFFLCLLTLANGEEELKVETLAKPEVCEKVAEEGDLLRVHYVGRFGDAGGDVFDASDRGGDGEGDGGGGRTYDFVLGAGQVIQGYEQGVPGMCQGERRALTVPPSLAYGEGGYPGVIPPAATLHFTVDLVEVVKAGDGAEWGGVRDEM